MEVRKFKAGTMQEALARVRSELGPSASVLRTREVPEHPLLRWIPGLRKIEITATADVRVPSRLPERRRQQQVTMPDRASDAESRSPGSAHGANAGGAFQAEVKTQLDQLQALVADLCRRTQQSDSRPELPGLLFQLYTRLIDADVSEEIAREFVDRLKANKPPRDTGDVNTLLGYVAEMIEAEVSTGGPIRINPGRRRTVALVGPTGVGKTTTIAKLAANYRLREKRRVGLITVDTYRVAAVEQLRTYADIIDLPMFVASTPREMREAVTQLDDLDLVLMDTAGRSPHDEVKIQELKAFLGEAQVDETLLVLSSISSSVSLRKTAEQFSAVGTTGLILTKLDEASGLGNLLSLVRASRLPLSYLTNGQNVPDDIEPAKPDRLARLILGLESACGR